jgi:nickel-dependent lactate racemase
MWEHLLFASKNFSPANQEYAAFVIIQDARKKNNLPLFYQVLHVIQIHRIAISNWSQRTMAETYRKFSHHVILTDWSNLFVTEIQQYRDHCQVYIHGHSAGGTNPIADEAMYSGNQ